MEKQEHSKRIQTSILNPLERRVLTYVAHRLPQWVTSDMLTAIGVIGSIIVAVGYAMTNFGAGWLWLASLGFVINWFGDSLDGTLARVRNTCRPLYGFYIDHNVDCICEFFMMACVGLCAYAHFWSGLLLMIPYLALEVYVMINAHLKDEFRLTYGKLGPTELRLLSIILNTVLYAFPAFREWSVTFQGLKGEETLTSVDCLCLGITAILVVMYLTSLWTDAKYFARIDPLHKDNS